MQIGKLRHRVTIQQKSSGQDSLGQPNKQWVDVCTVWAQVHERSGKELLSSSAEQSETTALIRIRYRKGITTDMRIVHNPPTGSGQIYDITAVITNEKRTQIEMMCSTGVKT